MLAEDKTVTAAAPRVKPSNIANTNGEYELRSDSNRWIGAGSDLSVEDSARRIQSGRVAAFLDRVLTHKKKAPELTFNSGARLNAATTDLD